MAALFCSRRPVDPSWQCEIWPRDTFRRVLFLVLHCGWRSYRHHQSNKHPRDLELFKWAGPIAILGVAVCHAETFFVSASLQNDTLRATSPWRRSRVIHVADIDSLRYSHLLQSYAIDSRFDGTIYLRLILSGLRNFLLGIESLGHPIPKNTPLYVRPFVD